MFLNAGPDSPTPAPRGRGNGALHSVAAVVSHRQQQQKKGRSLLYGLLRRPQRRSPPSTSPSPMISMHIGSSPGRRPVRVAYQDTPCCYCREAAEIVVHPSHVCDAFPCTDMEDAFSALEDRSADRAVVLAENSIDGPIHRNLDLLLRHEEVSIVGELVLPVEHCLLSLHRAPISSIRRVVSQPQALSHCRGRLEELGVEVDEVSSAADAVNYLAESGVTDTAMIGSKLAAKEFGLRVLENNFQDPGVNFNRYLHLCLASGSGSEIRPGGARKTTVAFSLEKGVADLFRTMWIFETRGVNVIRVEHRPNRSNPIRFGEKAAYFDYVFIMDLEGNGADPKVEQALMGLKEIAGFVRVLGSYTSTV